MKAYFKMGNDLVLNLMIFIASDISLWYRSHYQNMWKYKDKNIWKKLTTI